MNIQGYRRFDERWLKASIADWLKRTVGSGNPAPEFMQIHTPTGAGYESWAMADHIPNGSRVMLSLDVGHHTSGWFKNPDYERCIHLSLSYRDPETGEPRPHDKKLSEEWCDLIFGAWKRYIWEESPKFPEGKQAEVWHYRVFCDPAWQPIIPRGEVYSRELTEAGWKSWSDQHESVPDQS